MPPMHRQTFGIIFLFTNTQKEKHAQGCPLVAGQVVAPQTAELEGPEKKGDGGVGAQVNKPASRKPVHWADL